MKGSGKEPDGSKTIALDIGGVCISIHYERCYERLGVPLGTEPPPEFLRDADLLERGMMSEEEWLSSFQRLMGGRLSKDDLREAWNLILGPSIPGMAGIVREMVSKGFRFAYLSDTSSIHMSHFFRSNDFCHLVSGGIFSHEVGAKKPEAKMYEAFEKEYGKPLLYLDDKQCNIDGALSRGWRARRFASPEDLSRALKELGV